MDLHKILSDIQKADIDYQLIQDGDRIAVGVSGGKDSMLLLTALHMYTKFPNKHFEVIGVHIKLGFPHMDFQNVEAFCQAQGITFHQFDSKVYEILKRNVDKHGRIKCSLCSKFKKATVNQAAKELNCNKVAFGHHSDDAVETLFMNAIHGGKLATFLPMMYLSKDDITFIRPLIYSFESDIEAAIHKNAIPIVKSTCPNDGFTQRQAIKDFLQELYQEYPMAKSNFVTMLHNEKQMELWQHVTQNDENDASKREQPTFQVLLEKESYTLGKQGRNYYILYVIDAKQHSLKIRDCDAQAILRDELSMKEVLVDYGVNENMHIM